MMGEGFNIGLLSARFAVDNDGGAVGGSCMSRSGAVDLWFSF